MTCIPDDDEPLATEEEAVRYNGNMEREAEIEEEYRRRYKGKLNKDTWCDQFLLIRIAVLSFYETKSVNRSAFQMLSRGISLIPVNL